MSLGTTAYRRILIGPHTNPISISKLMPTSPTDELIKSCWIRHLYIVNVSGSASTILVCDRDVTPVYLISTSLPNGAMLSLTDDEGVYMLDGLTWSSSQSNVSVKLAGSYNP